jgi:hypothetical protein
MDCDLLRVLMRGTLAGTHLCHVVGNPANREAVIVQPLMPVPWSQLIKLVTETVMSVFAVFEARDLPRFRLHP